MSQPTSAYNRPLPPEIYRRRRVAAVVVALVVLVVLVLIVRAITGGGGESSTAAGDSSTSTATSARASSSAAGTASTGASETATGGADGSTAATSSAQETTTADAAEPGAQCVPDDLQLAVRAGAPTYAAGQLPDFFLTVTNGSDSPCSVDLAESPMSFEVFTLSTYEKVWADTDCNSPTATDTVDLAAGESRSFSLNGWSRTTSAPGQCTDRADVGTGAFLLYGHLGEKVSEPETFNLA